MGRYAVERSFQTSFPRHGAGGVVYLKQSNYKQTVASCCKYHRKNASTLYSLYSDSGPGA